MQAKNSTLTINMIYDQPRVYASVCPYTLLPPANEGCFSSGPNSNFAIV